ncbi:MAG: protein translocase subunit SecF, partial [Pseudomonadota bacterium]|nr:protein translocase subunit SecF [Pseudomonadota bacterium]
MEFFKINRNIPFMSYGRYTTTISLVTFILAVFFIVTKGLNFGVDFTGGTVMEVHYAQTVDLDKVRRQLTDMGLHDVLVQNFGSSHDVLLQVSLKQNVVGAKLSEQILDKLRQQDASVEMRRVEFVGPQVGKDLVENGALALLLVSIGIACYLWVRFEWKFGLAAIIANLHDVIIIIGFFAFFQWDFSLTVLAALLAV